MASSTLSSTDKEMAAAVAEALRLTAARVADCFAQQGRQAASLSSASVVSKRVRATADAVGGVSHTCCCARWVVCERLDGAFLFHIRAFSSPSPPFQRFRALISK